MNPLEFTGRLPLCLDADITSECWNFYRMAIVNAYPEQDFCLANRLNHIYMDRSREIHYGFSMDKENPYRTYEPVLETQIQPLRDLPDAASFVEFAYTCLREGTYPLFECDYHLLLGSTEETEGELGLHEVLLYGAEEGQFLFPWLKNGRWREHRAPVQTVAAAFLRRRNTPREWEEDNFWRRNYLAPYMVLKVRKETRPRINPYDFYRDIGLILQACCLENRLVQEGSLPFGREFSGVLAVYNGMLELTEEIRDGRFDVRKEEFSLPLNAKRLYEYARLFTKHVRLLDQCRFFEVPCAVYEKLQDLIGKNQRVYLLSIKYLRTGERKDIEQMREFLYFAFGVHVEALKTLQEAMRTQLIDSWRP